MQTGESLWAAFEADLFEKENVCRIFQFLALSNSLNVVPEKTTKIASVVTTNSVESTRLEKDTRGFSFWQRLD